MLEFVALLLLLISIWYHSQYHFH